MSNNISIRNIDPQEITINSENVVYGITNVYVNGVDVTVGSKAYVVVPTKTSELTNDSGFITNAEETDPTVPYYVKQITQADINSWNDKQDLLVSGTTIKTINSNSLLGSGNLEIGADYTAGEGISIEDNIISNTVTSYNDLSDLPIPITSTSQLTNDSGFITKNVNDLTNYYNIELLSKILPESTDSGSELYLEDTADLPLRLDLNPSEITQHTTTGKNLFDKDTITPNKVLANDGSLNDNAGYIVGDYISVSPSTDYTIRFTSVSTELLRVGYYDTDKTFLSRPTSADNPWTITTPNNCYYIRVCTPTAYQQVQVEEGSTSTPYEEYTGGEPSPNPLYPQTLHTVSGTNSINIYNKNLYDPSYRNSSNNIYCVNATATESDGVFTLTATGSDMYMWQIRTSGNSYNPDNQGQLFKLTDEDYTITITNHTMTANYITFYDKDLVSLGYISFGNNYTKTFNISDVNVPDDSKYFSLRVGYASANIGQAYKFSVQIEKGNTSTSYMKYQKQEYPIELNNVYNADTQGYEDLYLTKITTTKGAYQTFFFKNYKDSEYYVEGSPENTIYYNEGVYKYVSSPDDNWYKEDLYGGGVQFSLDINNLYAGALSVVKSDYFTDISQVNDPDNESCIMAIMNTLSVRFNSNMNITTLEDFQTWLSNNQFTCYIARTGTTIESQRGSTIGKYTDLSEQYHNVMDNAMAYNEVTNVMQESNDLPYDLKASTLKKIS